MVDYFSLDVEGAEMGILRTIPFDKVKIRTFTIEYNGNPKAAKEMEALMGKNGYQMVKDISRQDLVFVLKSEIQNKSVDIFGLKG